jgi:uncharacterized protein YjbK
MKKEIELKYLIPAKEDFLRLKEVLVPYQLQEAEEIVQKNYYFDTLKRSLKKDGISLRLREENENYIITAKQSLGKKSTHNLSVRLEYEGEVSQEVGELIAEQLLSPLEAFRSLKNFENEPTKKLLYSHIKKASNFELMLVGTFINHRTGIPIEILDHRLVLQLDHSFYPNNLEFFEVEIEFVSTKEILLLRPLIENLFTKNKIKTKQSTSKSSRLYRILFGKNYK